MTARTEVSDPVRPEQEERVSSAVYTEGLLAGVVGAATIAGWFLLLDSIAGRPLYTPSVLGTALVRGGEAIAAPDTLPVDMEMVLTFTWMHVLAFLVIGLAASKLLEQAERDPNLGFGILLLFVVFEFGFIAVFSTVAGERGSRGAYAGGAPHPHPSSASARRRRTATPRSSSASSTR